MRETLTFGTMSDMSVLPLFRQVVDVALDRTIVLGYSSPGIAVRRRLGAWDPLPRLDGKTVLVTGATAGLGQAAARAMVGLGADVHILGRDARRTEAAAAELGATPHLCDVSSLSSLRAFTDGWSGKVDVLVNNAGVMPPRRVLTDDGVELTFATNVIGPFWLSLALPLDGARNIIVSSGGMYGQRLDADLQNERYAPVMAYARTKRAEVVLTEMLAERRPATRVHAMHPGWADTPGVATSLTTFSKVTKPILRTPDQGADTIVWLAGADEPGRTTGLFWHDRRPRPTHLFGLNKETLQDRARLWDECVRITGLGGQESRPA